MENNTSTNTTNTTNTINTINNYKKKYRKKNDYYCANCGKYGHVYKYCKEPIISSGIILIDIQPSIGTDTICNDIFQQYCQKDVKDVKDVKDLYNDEILTSTNININVNTKGIKYNNKEDLLTWCKYKNNIKFLMVRRKHTLGYIEFIRGRYSIENLEGIIFLFKQMIKSEIDKINTYTFDQLWKDLWSTNNTIHKNEYNKSKRKFEKLKSGEDTELDLNYYVSKIKPAFKHAEWGFPKGRRNFHETDLECAIREFKEETGYKDGDFTICNKIIPIVESLTGTNGKKYKHIYHMAFNNTTNKELKLDPNNSHQFNEIGDIGWFIYEDIIKLFRPYHVERYKIIMNIYMYIMNHIRRLKKR